MSGLSRGIGRYAVLGGGGDTPRFTERLDWEECPLCSAHFDEDRPGHRMSLNHCPECGQPPRCTWWCEDRSGKRCKREASIDPLGSGMVGICGQHYVLSDLNFHLEECDFAHRWLKLYRALADEHGNEFLTEAFDMAWAQLQMSRERILEEQRAIWKD